MSERPGPEDPDPSALASRARLMGAGFLLAATAVAIDRWFARTDSPVLALAVLTIGGCGLGFGAYAFFSMASRFIARNGKR